MFIEIQDQGVKGGPMKVLVAIDSIEAIYTGNEEIVATIHLRSGRQIYIAEGYEEVAKQLRELGLLAKA